MMFGLMKVATHKAEIQRIQDALGYGFSDPVYIAGWMVKQLAKARTRQETADAEIATLKARIAELEKPVSITKAVPIGKAKPVNKAAKVPVKGKVKS